MDTLADRLALLISRILSTQGFVGEGQALTLTEHGLPNAELVVRVDGSQERWPSSGTGAWLTQTMRRSKGQREFLHPLKS